MLNGDYIDVDLIEEGDIIWFPEIDRFEMVTQVFYGLGGSVTISVSRDIVAVKHDFTYKKNKKLLIM